MKEKSVELIAFEAATKKLRTSRHYVDDVGSLSRRISNLEVEILEKQKILNEWKQKLERELKRSQLTLGI